MEVPGCDRANAPQAATVVWSMETVPATAGPGAEAEFTFMTRVTINRLRCAACAACLATALGAVAAVTPEDTRIILEQFRTRGMSEDGRTEWELSGAHAVVDGAQVELRDATLVFRSQKGETATITSPRFSFNRTEKSGASDAPLHVAHRQVVVDGVGYDILADQQVLHIRSQVRMRIQHEQQGLGERLFRRPTPAPPAAPAATEGNTP